MNGVLDVRGDGLVGVVVQASQSERDGAVAVPFEVVLVDHGGADVLALRGGEAQHRALLDDLAGGDRHGGEHTASVQRRGRGVDPASRGAVGWSAHGGR